MEFFKSWLISVCGASAITSLCKILISKSKLRKTSNIFLSMFVLLYMILPLYNDQIKKSYEYTEEYEEINFDLNYKDGYEKIIYESIKNTCNENNVEIISLDISSYIDENGYLFVDLISVDIDNNAKAIDIESQIRNKFGFEVTVF